MGLTRTYVAHAITVHPGFALTKKLPWSSCWMNYFRRVPTIILVSPPHIDTNVDDGVDEPILRDYIARQVHKIKMAKVLNSLLAQRCLVMGYTDDEDEDDDL